MWPPPRGQKLTFHNIRIVLIPVELSLAPFLHAGKLMTVSAVSFVEYHIAEGVIPAKGTQRRVARPGPIQGAEKSGDTDTYEGASSIVA